MRKWLIRHNYKHKIVFATHLITTAMYIWFYIQIFLTMYLNGKNKGMMFYINNYNEADVELILLSALLPLCITGVVLNYIFLRKYL